MGGGRGRGRRVVGGGRMGGISGRGGMGGFLLGHDGGRGVE